MKENKTKTYTVKVSENTMEKMKEYFENGNCAEKCSEGYFSNNKNCEECEKSCKTYNKKKNNCTSCYAGEYLNKESSTYICSNCSENCETCSAGKKGEINNCLTCKQNSKYKFLYEKNCLDKCPNHTITNEKNDAEK